MLPTIKDGEVLRVSRLDSQSRKQLTRGEIIVFRYPADQTKSYIKRLIGLPGDRIEIRDGEVWVNDSRLAELYVSPRLNLLMRTKAAVTVPVHAYYVMGDNRDNSSDSRIWGTVPEELIDAKVLGR